MDLPAKTEKPKEVEKVVRTDPVITEQVHHVEKEIPIVEKETTVVHDQPVIFHEKAQQVVQEPATHAFRGEPTTTAESIPAEPLFIEKTTHVTREIPVHETERTIIHEKPIVTHEKETEYVHEPPIHVDTGVAAAPTTTTGQKIATSDVAPPMGATTTTSTTTTTAIPTTEELPLEKKPGILHKLKEDIKHAFRGDRV